MAAPSMKRISRWNYGLGAIVSLVAFATQPLAISLGVFVGVVLTCLNFFLLSKIIARATDGSTQSTSSMLLVLPKMTVLMLAVVLALWLLPISAPAFALGYSIFVVSILIEAIYSVAAPQRTQDFPSTEESSSEKQQ